MHKQHQRVTCRSKSNLQSLLKQSVPFEPFAERRVEKRFLIDPMTRFGTLECGYRSNDILGGDYKTLDTLRLAAPGKALLTLLKKSS